MLLQENITHLHILKVIEVGSNKKLKIYYKENKGNVLSVKGHLMEHFIK